MSKGYIPKKRLKEKRLRRLRKKYKNFSCDTCAKKQMGSCEKRYQPTKGGTLMVCYYENCDEWKAG